MEGTLREFFIVINKEGMVSFDRRDTVPSFF